jgi:hypothetical protein
VSGITLSTGPLTVVDGFIEVPENATAGDFGGLAVYGFTPAPALSKISNSATKTPVKDPTDTPTE